MITWEKVKKKSSYETNRDAPTKQWGCAFWQVITSLVLTVIVTQVQIWLLIKLCPNTNVAQRKEIICMERRSEFNRLSVIGSFRW